MRLAAIAALLSMLLAATGAARPAAQGDASETLRDGPLVVHYWPGAKRLAAGLLSVTAPELPALPEAALSRGAPIHIYLAPDPVRFDSLTGGLAPEWGAGVAFPAAGRIVLPAFASDRGSRTNLGRVLRHELAHVALHRYLAPIRVPRWFDEGYARWAAGEWDWSAGWMLRLAFALGRAPPLDSLALSWPAGETDARVAYLLATSTIVYLTEHGGERGLRLLLTRWERTGSLDQALRRTYGVTLSQFEEDWREYVEDRFGWALFLSHSVVLWSFAALLVLVLSYRRRREYRKRLERLRATEPPDDPAYWRKDYEPPAPPYGTDAVDDSDRAG